MKKIIGKVLVMVAALGVSFAAHTEDYVQAKTINVSTESSSITMKNAGLQGVGQAEFYVENATKGTKVVMSVADDKIASFYVNEYEFNEKDKDGTDNQKSIKLHKEKTIIIGENDDEDYDEEEDGEYINAELLPLTVGSTSVTVSVYSTSNTVVASKTIPVTVKKATMKLRRSDERTNKVLTLSEKNTWNCQCGAWENGNFWLENVPFGSTVTLSVSKKSMYKYINSYYIYQWKKMKKDTYIVQANNDTFGDAYSFILYPIKAGKATIKVTVQSGDKTTTYVIKNKATKYSNPLKKLVINGKNKTKVFNNMQCLRTGTNLETKKSLDMYQTKGKNMTGQIKMKKGYKLVCIYNGRKKVKLKKSKGSYYFSIPVNKINGGLKITYKNKKGKYHYLLNYEA